MTYLIFSEYFSLLEEIEQFSPWTVLQSEMQFVFALESIEHAYDEWVFNFNQYIPLDEYMFFLFSFFNILLFKYLHSQDLLSILNIER